MLLEQRTPNTVIWHEPIEHHANLEITRKLACRPKGDVKQRDYLAVVEAAYAAAASEEDWLQGIAEAALPILDRGAGTLAYSYDASDPRRVHMSKFAQAGGNAQLAKDAYAFTSSLSPAQQRLFYCASPPTQRAARIFEAEPPSRRTAELLRDAAFVSVDAIGVRGHNPDQRGCVLSALSERPYVLAPRTRGCLDRIALHLAAAFRLRERTRGASLADACAIFSSRGRIEDRNAAAAQELEPLSAAVNARIQGQQVRRQEPERALELWRALFDGRWSVVDHVDRDGKRFILARRNEVALDNPLALDRTERVVAHYASWGHSNKLIAYETGLAPSTVSVALARALRKLRLRSRSDLIGLFSKRK